MTTNNTRDAERERFEAKIRATSFTGEVNWNGSEYTNAWVQGQFDPIARRWALEEREASLRQQGADAERARLRPLLEGVREALANSNVELKCALDRETSIVGRELLTLHVANGALELVDSGTRPEIGDKLSYKQIKDHGFNDWLGKASPKPDYYVLRKY